MSTQKSTRDYLFNNCQNLETTKINGGTSRKRNYYLALKRNQLSSYDNTRMKLKCIFLKKEAILENLHTV